MEAALMKAAPSSAASDTADRPHYIEIVASTLPSWGFSWTPGEAIPDGSNARQVRPEQDELRSPSEVCEGCEWIGREAKAVSVGGRAYHLSYVFLGRVQDIKTSAVIDPQLPVGAASPSAPTPNELTSYAEFDPAIRRAYLAWINGGRLDPSVPGAFLLHFVYSLEMAIVRDGRHELAGSAREELEELLKLHRNDVAFRTSTSALLELLSLIDPNGPVRPIFASAKSNPGDEMPFDVRRYLGELLRFSPSLEADPALLFVLQQPGTRLDAHLAQNFAVVHHHWSEDFAYRFQGGIELCPERCLSIDYECLDGETHAEIKSSIPDPASAAVPAELREFFMQCCAEAEALRDLPVSQQVAAIKALKPKRRPQDRRTPPLRPDLEQQIMARLAGQEPVRLPAEQVLGELFEDLDLSPNKQIPVPVIRAMQRALDDIGVGFEPDERYGLPAGIRPGSEVVLFLEESLPFEKPSDAYHLGQSAMALSAIGCSAFAGLEPLDPADLEQRLPYRYRFSDRELRRLRASFLAMAGAGSPRDRLVAWARLMKKMQRTKDIHQGFGLALHAQQGNPLVKRFATAVSKAVRDDDLLAKSLLREVKEQAVLDSSTLVEAHHNVIAMDDYRQSQGVLSITDESPASRLDKSEATQSRIEGLPAGVADILVALTVRPRSRTELNEIARGRLLQISGALEQLNEWSLVTLGVHVTRGHHTVRINPEAVDAVELMLRQS
jgi:hypothetical protein